MKNVYIGYASVSNLDKDYKYNVGKDEISAKFSNEASFKYAVKLAEQDHQKIDKAVFICTSGVKNGKVYPYLKNITKELTDCEFFEIDTEDDLNIYNDISEILKYIEKDDNLYIDMTGGPRMAAVPIMLICNYLQRRGNIIKAEIYSNILSDKSPGEIKNSMEEQRVMKLIDGIEEFATSARVNTLMSDQVFGNSENEKINALLSCMKNFSESIMMGKTGKLDDNMQKLTTAMDNLKNDNDSDAFVILFKSMLPTIKEKFFSGDSNEINSLHLIKWCLDNGLLQQALVLCVEKIPDVLINNKIVEYNGKIKDDYSPLYGSKNSALIYGDLLEVTDIYKELGRVMEKIKTANNKDTAIRQQISEHRDLENAINILKSLDDELNLKNTFGRNFKITSKDNRTKKSYKYLSETTCKSAWTCTANDFKKIVLEDSGIPIPEDQSDVVKRLNKIKKITRENELSADFKINIEPDKLEKILVGYVYLKYIRNQISHAGQYEELSSDAKDFLKENGYSYEYTENAISDDVRIIIETIEKD